MLKCPYCGSHRLKTTGGENGNPFDRHPENTVCLDCGRTVAHSEPKKSLATPDLSAAGRMMDELNHAKSDEEHPSVGSSHKSVE